MTKRLVFVDGYNLIRNDPTLSAIEARSLDAGRRALVSRLLTSFNLQTNDITVVFDGANEALPLPASERYGPVKVIFSRQGETADAVILRLVAATPPGRQVVLLSDDGELRSAVQGRGGIVGGAANRARPRPTPYDQAKKEADKTPRGTDKKGNPRRAKRRPRQQPAVRW
jgi:predicted RNA-binding protein with PIN domain